MAAIVNGDVIRCVFYNRTTVQNGLNVRYFKCVGVAGAGTTDAAVALAFGSTMATLYKSYMSNEAKYLGCTVQIVNPAVVPPAVSTNGTGNGTVLDQVLPPQTAGLVTLRTALAGRKYRGRIYLPFASESGNTDTGVPTAGVKTIFGSIATFFTTDQNVGDMTDNATFRPGLWSQARLEFTPTIAYVVRGAWATQRRRSLVGKADSLPFGS